jgi:hypothetical protein
MRLQVGEEEGNYRTPLQSKDIWNSDRGHHFANTLSIFVDQGSVFIRLAAEEIRFAWIAAGFVIYGRKAA